MTDRIALLAAEFPAHWQTYIVDEGQHFATEGVRVFYFTTRTPRPAYLSETLSRQIGSITRLYPPGIRDAAYFPTHPGELRRALGYVLRMENGGAAGRLRGIALLPSAARLIRSLRRNQAGHLHVHSFGNAAHLAAIAHICAGIPYTLTLHGSLAVWGGDIALKASHAARVFSVTRPLKDELSAYYPSERIEVLPMGIDVRKFFPRSASAQRLPDPFTVVTVARLHPSKGHVYALQALRRLRDDGVSIRYRIVGSGDHRPSIEDDIAELGLDRDVELLGPRSSDEISDILKDADALVLPSVGLGEAAPVSVMEAMASGLPVVCSRIGGTADMIEDGEDGLLVEQKDVDGLVGALRRLVEDPAERSRLGENARRTAEDRFDGRRVSGRVLSAIRSLGAEAQA